MILRLGGLWRKRRVKRFSPAGRFRIGNRVGLPKIALRGGLEDRRQSGKRNRKQRILTLWAWFLKAWCGPRASEARSRTISSGCSFAGPSIIYAVSAPAVALPSQRGRPIGPNSGYRLERVAPAMPLVWNSLTDGAGTLRPQDALDMAAERQCPEGAVRNWSQRWARTRKLWANGAFWVEGPRPPRNANGTQASAGRGNRSNARSPARQEALLA